MASMALATGYNCYQNFRKHRSGSSVPCVVLSQHHNNNNEPIQQKPNNQLPRWDIILRSSELAVISSLFHFSGEKPDYLGAQRNCGNIKDCVSTWDDVADHAHYAPPWNYNGGRGRKSPVSREVAMKELLEAVKKKSLFTFFVTPRIVEQKDDYVRVEYERFVTGFVDDVEFWFRPGRNSIVEYRSASRSRNLDSHINRKIIEALRRALEKKGWASEDRT